VDGRHDRSGDEVAVREGQEVEAVVDHVEVGGALEHGGDVEALGDLRIDVVVLRPAVRRRAVQGGGGDRVTGREERHVVTGGDEAVGEGGGEQLPWSVVAWRRAPGDGREHGDAERI